MTPIAQLPQRALALLIWTWTSEALGNDPWIPCSGLPAAAEAAGIMSSRSAERALRDLEDNGWVMRPAPTRTRHILRWHLAAGPDPRSSERLNEGEPRPGEAIETWRTRVAARVLQVASEMGDATGNRVVELLALHHMWGGQSHHLEMAIEQLEALDLVEPLRAPHGQYLISGSRRVSAILVADPAYDPRAAEGLARLP